jgi:tetratricopeptide (TPR) repeat protein
MADSILYRLCIVVALHLAVDLACARQVQAEPREEGYQAYRRGDYTAAIGLFKKAYLQLKDPNLLYNIAKCNEKLARVEDALKAYQQYLKQKPTAPDRAAVEEKIIGLKRRLRETFASVEFVSAPAGAQVFVNDSFIGPTTIAYKLTPGRHAIRFVHEGYEIVERAMEVEKGKDQRLAVILKPIPKVGTLVLQGDLEGASITIDGQTHRSQTNSFVRELEIGEHQISVARAGRAPFATSVRVRQGESSIVAVRLELAKRPLPKKAIAAFVCFGVVAAAEAAAWMSYASAAARYRDEPDFTTERNVSIGMHLVAAVAAASGGALLTWWLVDRGKDSSDGKLSLRVSSAGGSVRLTW